MAHLRAMDVTEFKRAKALKTDSLEAQIGKKVKVEEIVILSPTTGRPIRAHAGKNKHIEA